ncbi:glycosyltransferase [Vulcanococcus limneticus]|uniref:glycosyltransferase n=1 Tax=Vulcanococcus limneticus TaxID=2170428 RepID=UPI00398C1761
MLGADTAPRLRRAASLVARAQAKAAPAHLVHSHGLWLAASRASRRLHRVGLPTVVAPHGMLDPWAWRRRRALKQLLWWAGERTTVQAASCLQALCHAERDAIRALGITAPIALIPNGVELPDRSAAARELLPPPPWLAHGVPDGAQVLLFLGRFHAKKGLEPLLAAWQRLQQRGSSEAWCVLAGFGDGGAMAQRLAVNPIPRLRVIGPVHGGAKASAFAHASGFVLPSFSEGLPMAALEAMAWGLPCLLSAACNLPAAFRTGSAWEAPPDVALLEGVLEHWLSAARTDPSALTAMGASGQALMAQQFSWHQVAAQTSELYAWLLGEAERPGFVEL